MSHDHRQQTELENYLLPLQLILDEMGLLNLEGFFDNIFLLLLFQDDHPQSHDCISLHSSFTQKELSLTQTN